MSGWKDDDAVTITYRTLCQAQSEAAAAEQQRIIKLWEEEMGCDCNQPMWHLMELIKGKN